MYKLYKGGKAAENCNSMKKLHLGIDIGSTTVKLVVLNEKLEILFCDYKRHFSDIKSSVKNLIRSI